MAEPVRHRVRLGLLWLFTLAAVAIVLVDTDDAMVAPSPPAVVSSPTPTPPRLRIVRISDAEVLPGDAVLLLADGLVPSAALSATVGHRPAAIVSRHDPEVVVRIPDDLPAGKSSIRLFQGDRRSKPHDLLVRELRLAKSLRNLLGGLALLLLGLRGLSGGLRKLAGHDLRRRLGGLVRGTPRAFASGTLLGAATQLATSSAAVALNLATSDLIGASAAVALLVGAQLGAALTGAFLPFAISRDSLVLLAAGVAWMLFAAHRRGQALGRLVAGAALVLYGLHLLDLGVAPFVAHPATLPIVSFLEQQTLLSIAACALLGVVLAAVLQGPGPVFALVVGLLQVTGALGLTNALAMLAGTPLGAALGTALVAWPLGPPARRIAWLQLRVGLISTVVLACTSSVWAYLAHLVAPGDLATTAFGQRILYPNAHAHLAIGFVAGQLTVTALVMLVLPRLTRLPSAATTATATAARRRPEGLALSMLVPACTDALRQVPLLVQRGDRNLAGEAERALATASRLVDAQLASDDHIRRAPLVAAAHLPRALAELVRVAERGIEGGLVLDERAHAALAAAHDLVSVSLTSLADALADGIVDLEAARAREIRLNAREADVRRELAASTGAAAGARWLGELLDAYEGVGNRVWRVLEAAAHELEDPED